MQEPQGWTDLAPTPSPLEKIRARANGETIYPPEGLVFNALTLTPLAAVKVVILGQDPYHGAGQAHGLSFSVPAGVKPPPSLVNIFKEQERDLGIPRAGRSGDLSGWARQGVLLLNTVLTVKANEAGSHQNMGWEDFTDDIIRTVNNRRQNVVFLLWGSHAQKKGRLVDRVRHLVLEAPHPSPLSAHRGFLGCGHFSAANAYLAAHGQSAIDWSA